MLTLEEYKEFERKFVSILGIVEGFNDLKNQNLISLGSFNSICKNLVDDFYLNTYSNFESDIQTLLNFIKDQTQIIIDDYDTDLQTVTDLSNDWNYNEFVGYYYEVEERVGYFERQFKSIYYLRYTLGKYENLLNSSNLNSLIYYPENISSFKNTHNEKEFNLLTDEFELVLNNYNQNLL